MGCIGIKFMICGANAFLQFNETIPIGLVTSALQFMFGEKLIGSFGVRIVPEEYLIQPFNNLNESYSSIFEISLFPSYILGLYIPETSRTFGNLMNERPRK